jgi:ADP-ribosylglycohydrolase
MRLTWAQPEDLVAHELVQAAAEGTDVTAIARRWVEAGGSVEPAVSGASDAPVDEDLRVYARELLAELDALAAAARAAGDPDEPDDLAGIEATRPGPPPRWAPPPAGPLLDRVTGGWLGRAAGCLLGKPVEKLPREGIREIARATGNWPVTTWFTAVGLPAEVAARWPWNRRSRPTSLAENIDGMPEDDDLNFTILALRLLEEHGSALDTEDVAAAWLADLPAGRVFTAERAAYRNLLDAYPPPLTATVRNPFREWIGAWIRTDAYGWAHPGDPAAAARLAWRDARLSHTRNGLYGAMFVAAATAAACVAPPGPDGVEAVLAAGLAVVPPRSGLAAAVRRGAELGRSEPDTERALDRLHAEYGHLHWVHVLNNAALVAYAVRASGGDLGAAIGIAVTGGWDTDSAGATAGALCGTLAGAAALPPQWTVPLRNRVTTSIPGPSPLALDELAARTVRVAAR